ncbi:hypothetical protein [Acrocarpospora catenulata]|nr:hypothetical protein [Acrocarpospora catenulata]
MTHTHHHSHAGDAEIHDVHEHHVDAEHEETGADQCVGLPDQDGCCATE